MGIANRIKLNIKYILSSFLIFCSINASCQGFNNGKLIASKSKAPLPWVNIGIIGKNIGTVSNDLGDFKILLNEKYNQDSIRISTIGYKSLKFRVDDFRDRILKNPIFEMQEEFVQLDEVFISNNVNKEYLLGNTEFTDTMVFGFQSNELGNEIGTIIKIEDGPVTIKTININIYKNKLHRFKIRVNIYDLKDGRPHLTILNENIIVECTKRKGLYSIDLSQYNIIAEEDVFVSLEWIEALSEENLYFSTTPKGSKTFTRHASQAYWVETKNVSLGLNIGVRY